MTSVVVDSVRKVIEGRGDTLETLSYQAGSLAGDQFFKGAISDKHQCVSKDGEHCSELFALVRWNEKNWPVDTWSHKKDGTFLSYGPSTLSMPQETATKYF